MYLYITLQEIFDFPETHAGGLSRELHNNASDDGRRQIRHRDVLQDILGRVGLDAEERTAARNDLRVRFATR